MTRARAVCLVAALVAPPAAEAASSAAARPWLADTCGSLVALQHDAALARVAPSAASARTVAAAVDTRLLALRRTAATVPAVPGGGAIAAQLSDAVLAASRSVAGRGPQVKTFAEARSYATRVGGAAHRLASAFLLLVAGNGSPALRRAVDRVPACGVVRG